MFADNEAQPSTERPSIDSVLHEPHADLPVVEGPGSAASGTDTESVVLVPPTTPIACVLGGSHYLVRPSTTRPSYDTHLLTKALEFLSAYEPPYPGSHGEEYILIRANAGYPREFLRPEDLEFLITQIDIVRPRFRKLYDSVIAGVRALVAIQGEVEKLRDGFGEEDGREAARKWMEVLGEVDTLLMGVEGEVGYTCPDRYGEGDGGERGEREGQTAE
jgi:hypothetical protein